MEDTNFEKEVSCLPLQNCLLPFCLMHEERQPTYGLIIIKLLSHLQQIYSLTQKRKWKTLYFILWVIVPK